MNQGFNIRLILLLAIAGIILAIAFFGPALNKKPADKETPRMETKGETKLPLPGDNR